MISFHSAAPTSREIRYRYIKVFLLLLGRPAALSRTLGGPLRPQFGNHLNELTHELVTFWLVDGHSNCYVIYFFQTSQIHLINKRGRGEMSSQQHPRFKLV